MSRRRRKLEWVTRLAALAVLALSAGWTRPPDAAAQDVIQRIEVDLGGGPVKVSLPFDEPFYLVGHAPAPLVRVSMHVLDNRRLPPGGKDCDTAAIPWDTSRVWMRSTNLSGDSFYVHVGQPLRANNLYSFCISTVTRLTGAELDSLHKNALAALDAQLTELDGQGSAKTADNIARFRRTLIARLNLGENQQLRAPKGSVFDSIVDTVAVRRYVDFAALQEPQNRRRAAAKQADDAVGPIQAGLAALARRPALAALRVGLGPKTAVNGFTAAEVQAALRTIRDLTDLSAFAAAAIADGGLALGSTDPVPAVQPRLADEWDTASVRIRLSRLDETSRALLGVRSLLIALRLSPKQLAALQVSQAGANDLVTRIDEVEELLATSRNGYARVERALADRRAAMEQSVARIGASARDEVTVAGSSVVSFEQRAKNTITADLGFAYAPRIGEVVPYLGANFYCGSINKRVPVRFADGACKRLSATLGVTAQSFAKAGRRDDLIAGVSLLLGGGLRLTDAIRVAGGMILFRAHTADPLLDRSHLAATPYGSLSLDFDAKAAVEKVTNAIFH